MKKINQPSLYNLNKIAVLMAAMAVSLTTFAQTEEEVENEDEYLNLDEIVVTGRNREENLQDVPVSITVLNDSLIADQNILTQGDLAQLVPGLWYNEGNGGESDRIAALPSIRGIASSEIATNRTKVTSFVDGIPIIGSVGAINIGGATQVEVFNGPQSAAFGRSTFGGAINYVTRDPGDEIEGTLGVNWSDQGTRIVSGSVGGPLIENLLGFQLGASLEDSVAPDDFYTYSDGTEAGTRGGTNWSGRLVFTPTERLSAKLTFAHDETDDGITARNFFATQESAAACFESLNSFDLYDGMAMESSSFAGEFDCELDRDTNAGLLGVQDIGAYYRENSDVLDGFVAAISDVVDAMAPPGTVSDLAEATQLATDAGFATIQDALLAIADAYSVTDEFVGSQSERDRVQLQVDYLFDNGSAVQLSFMDGDETYIRDYITYDSEVPYELGFVASAVPGMSPPGTPADPASLGWILPGGMAGFSMSDPTVIEEEYAEIRWASPAEQRMRYVAGAAYYKYDFLTEIYDEGYNAVRLGTEQAIYDLTGDVIAPNRTISETATNQAIFFNVGYDFTDKITGSIEGRYSEDDVGAILLNYSADDDGELTITQHQDSVVTKTFSPRLALNYAISDESTAYIQYAVGVNPAGINSDFLDPDVISSFNEGYLLDLNADGTVDADELYVPGDSVIYELDRYAQFEEEKLTNFELGFKGSAMDNRLSYSAAFYHMIWEDQITGTTIDWEHPNVTNDEDLYYTQIGNTADLYIPASSEDLVETGVGGFDINQGESTSQGLEFQANYRINDSWSINGNTSYLDAKYTDFCSEDDFNGIDPEIVGGVVTVYSDAGHYAGLEESVSAEGNPCYIMDGNRLARQPAFTLSLSPSYRTEFGDGIGLSVNTRFQYSGSSYNEVENISKTPASFRVNVTFGLTWNNFSGSFYVSNLLDDTSVTSGRFVQDTTYEGTYGTGTVDQALTFMTSDLSTRNYSTFEYSINEGRNVGLRASYRF